MQSKTFETTIPARLERLPWGRFHWLVVVALGITWILDGLEVTLIGSISGALQSSPSLRFSESEVGLAGSAYVLGAVVGALFFGWLTDRLGRKKLFFLTIGVYLVGTALTGLSWNAPAFFICRFIAGAGIGGEYAAINSAIQELIPARYRGRTDLAINGSFWIGAALGAVFAVLLLTPSIINPELGWRLAFISGAVIGAAVFFMRVWIPESPRWLVIHGRLEEADAIVTNLEREFQAAGADLSPVEQGMRLHARDHTPLTEVFHALLVTYRARALVGFALMAAQAFFYNAIFFTYALVLTKFYQVSSDHVGWYILPFAVGNFLGPIALGPLFDSLGRRRMLAITYCLSGALLFVAGALFALDALTAMSLTFVWMVVFFFASPAASAAYLTVSETFPLEIRALTIAIFYAIGTGIGGVVAPFLFGRLIESGSRPGVFVGYTVAAALMIGAGVLAGFFAVAAERRSLEDVAKPLSAA